MYYCKKKKKKQMTEKYKYNDPTSVKMKEKQTKMTDLG